MTISIGGLSSQPLSPQPETAANEFDATPLTSNISINGSQAADAGTADEITPTLIAGTASISALTSMAMNADDSRLSHVEQLRQSVADGTYQLKPLASVAEALLAEWR
ncbi:MAG: hypothetical protein WCB53_17670 [Terriglobales bacterium]